MIVFKIILKCIVHFKKYFLVSIKTTKSNILAHLRKYLLNFSVSVRCSDLVVFQKGQFCWWPHPVSPIFVLKFEIWNFGSRGLGLCSLEFGWALCLDLCATLDICYVWFFHNRIVQCAPIYSGRAPLVQISIGNSAKTKHSRYQVWHINPGTNLMRIHLVMVPGL